MQDLVVPVSVSFVAGGLAADPPSINLMLTLDPSALVACPRPALCRLALLADAVSALAPEGSPLRLPSAGAAAAAPPARSGSRSRRNKRPASATASAAGPFSASGDGDSTLAQQGSGDDKEAALAAAAATAAAAAAAAAAAPAHPAGSTWTAEPAEGAAPPAGSAEPPLHWDAYSLLAEAHVYVAYYDAWADMWRRALSERVELCSG